MIEPQDCLQQPPEAESHRLASFNFRITPALMAEWFNVRELADPNRSDGLEGNQSKSVSIFRCAGDGFDDPTGAVKVPRRPNPCLTVFKYI
jgi:hypothetical protein